MNWFATTFSSSIGRKVLVGVTGLGLVGFLVAHMFGNLNIYCGTDALNSYAEHLHNLPGFGLIELGLLLLFVVHIVLVIGLTRANRAARAGRYAVTASKREDGGSLSAKASKAMVVSGLVMLGSFHSLVEVGLLQPGDAQLCGREDLGAVCLSSANA